MNRKGAEDAKVRKETCKETDVICRGARLCMREKMNHEDTAQ
jgi:hypothetical protein